MQQYMLHCLQQKHSLIIQLLLLIVPKCNTSLPILSPILVSVFCFVLFFFFGGSKFSLSDKELSSAESELFPL